MGSGKNSNSDTSSEEIDQPEKLNDDNSGIGRSYECTFCKRGFTNAQALGGHMNIHRKDKAKAKQKNQEATNSHGRKKTHHHEDNYNMTSPKYYAQVSSHDHQHQYNTAVGAYMSYQVYYPGSNPSYIHAYNDHHHHQFDLPSPKPDHIYAYDHKYHMDQGLSLRMGPPHTEAGEERMNMMNESDIDLELRLGHHP